MEKLFLFGASGQLGSEWQQYFTHFSDSELFLIPYTSSQLDISRSKDIEHKIEEQQPDAIINCAAYTQVDKAEEERDKALELNAHAVKNMADLCSRFDIKLIHFSTDYIFPGKKEDQKRFPKGYPENYQSNPVNWYGQTKWRGEQAIRNSGCRHLIMRVSWLCGACGSNFVKTMLRLAKEHRQLRVVDDQIGSPTFTHNLVRNTFKLIEENQSGTYHLTSNGMISWADFAEAIFEMADQQVSVQRIPSAEFPTKAARPLYSKLNTDKIKRVEGIELENWKSGLNRLINELT